MRRLALVAALLFLLVVLVPSTRARVKAVPTLADAVGIIDSRPLAPPIRSVRAAVGGVRGRLDAPDWDAPAILLVPGATPEGVDDERVRNVATALAHAGRAVFTPQLELYQRRLTDEDLTRLRAAARALHARYGSVTMLGFSFGGSLALLAAANLDVVEHVAVFGAYVDLVGVIQAATTGVAIVGDVRVNWEPEGDVARFFASFLASLLHPDQAGAVLAAVNGDRPVSSLDDAERRVYELVANDDPERTRALVERLPDRVQRPVQRFSPVTVADEIDANIVAIHSVDDPAVPYTEALRLSRAFPDARLLTLRSFQHVDPTADDLVGWLTAPRDAVRATRFVGWVLSAGEPAVPATFERLS